MGTIGALVWRFPTDFGTSSLTVGVSMSNRLLSNDILYYGTQSIAWLCGGLMERHAEER